MCPHDSTGVGAGFTLLYLTADWNGRWKGLQEQRWFCLIRSFVLLPLLWWALGFNSAAPVCSGIRLLPWQSHTYSHSSGILLILCPANTQRRSHMHSWILECMHVEPLGYKYWTHNVTYTYIQAHTHTEPIHTSTVYHGQAWRALSLELSLTWMQIHAPPICQLTALHVGCMCNLDPRRPIWHHVASYISHRVCRTVYLRLSSAIQGQSPGHLPLASGALSHSRRDGRRLRRDWGKSGRKREKRVGRRNGGCQWNGRGGDEGICINFMTVCSSCNKHQEKVERTDGSFSE